MSSTRQYAGTDRRLRRGVTRELGAHNDRRQTLFQAARNRRYVRHQLSKSLHDSRALVGIPTKLG